MTSYGSSFASLYDDIYSSKNYKLESDFISGFASAGSRLIDIGCGTLSHSLLLHDKFDYILGIDDSIEMLHEAKRKLLRENIQNIHLKKSSLSELPGNEDFNLAISLFNVINHIMTLTELCDFFSQVYKRLKPGGQFVFDFWNGAFFRVESPTRESNRLIESKFGRIEIETISETDLMLGEVVMRSKFSVSPKTGEKSFFENSMPHRIWTPDIVLELLKVAGFIHISITPAFDSSRTATLTDRIIMVVCSK